MRSLGAIFLAGIGILLSIPQWSGAHWVQAGSPGGVWITSLTVIGTNLFASTTGGGVFVSKNNGSSWEGGQFKTAARIAL